MLPSGRAVSLTHLATAERPWDAVDLGRGLYALARQKRGDASTLECYRGAASEPLLFNAADAAVLVERLNRAPPARRPRVHW